MYTELLDTAIGLPILSDHKIEFEPAVDSESGEIRLKDFLYQATPYRLIKKVLTAMQPKESDTVIDIGCGYGRFCLYGALTTDANYIGIDTIGKRILEAQRAQTAFGISNASFVNTNVLSYDLSRGNIFYMFNPFWPNGIETEKEVANRLQALGKRNKVTVITLSMHGRFGEFTSQTFQKNQEKSLNTDSLEVYTSAPTNHF